MLLKDPCLPHRQFGMAIPLVGLCVIMSTGVRLLHDMHVLGQVTLAAAKHTPQQRTDAPTLAESRDIAHGPILIVALTTLLVWGWSTVDFLDGWWAVVGLGAMLAASLVIFMAIWLAQ